MSAAESDYDAAAFVISSQYRETVIQHLREQPATPSTIAEEAGYDISHVSRALTTLREEGYVELLVEEERRKGRIYGLSDSGAELLPVLEEVGLGS